MLRHRGSHLTEMKSTPAPTDELCRALGGKTKLRSVGIYSEGQGVAQRIGSCSVVRADEKKLILTALHVPEACEEKYSGTFVGPLGAVIPGPWLARFRPLDIAVA